MKPSLLLVLFVVAGCGAETAKMRVWGEASYDGKPIERGRCTGCEQYARVRSNDRCRLK